MDAQGYLKTKVINFGSTNETLQFTIYSLTQLMEAFHQYKLNERSINVHNSIATQYAEFCVHCDRKGLPLIPLDDYIKNVLH